jgi:hypothetical protein
VLSVQLDTELPQVPLAADYFEHREGEHWAGRRLDSAPMLCRSREARRWHRPRSGKVWQRDGRVSLLYWCGASSAGPYLFAAELPDGDQSCGTCEGRAVGAGFPSSVFPDAAVLFQPRTGTPALCGAGHWEALNPPRGSIGRCRWCGAVERIVGGSRGYGWTPVRMAPHAPLALFAPCHDHGYLSIVDVDGQLVCRCRCERVPSA